MLVWIVVYLVGFVITLAAMSLDSEFDRRMSANEPGDNDAVDIFFSFIWPITWVGIIVCVIILRSRRKQAQIRRAKLRHPVKVVQPTSTQGGLHSESGGY